MLLLLLLLLGSLWGLAEDGRGRGAGTVSLHWVLLHPAPHDIPQHVVRGVSLDGVGVSVREGHSIALLKNGRPRETMRHDTTSLPQKAHTL